MIEFSKRLKELRLDGGFTQQSIADELGIKQQSYARYELGNGEPSLQTLVKIAEIFDVSTDYLLGITDY